MASSRAGCSPTTCRKLSSAWRKRGLSSTGPEPGVANPRVRGGGAPREALGMGAAETFGLKYEGTMTASIATSRGAHASSPYRCPARRAGSLQRGSRGTSSSSLHSASSWRRSASSETEFEILLETEDLPLVRVVDAAAGPACDPGTLVYLVSQTAAALAGAA
jgi:hypothetical protein